MLQHTQSHCVACQRPTLFVRNTYDVPHVVYVVLVCASVLATLIARDVVLLSLFGLSAAVWVFFWSVHAIANLVTAGAPFRCHHCGTEAPTGKTLEAIDERQRLDRAM